MNIDLPTKFTANYKQNQFATIKRGVLKINKNCEFSKLMYVITYNLKNYSRCPYCGQKMKKTTLDHAYPRDLGGPTITNNLVPCCQECNIQKQNLTMEQFKNLLLIKKESEKKRYLLDIKKHQEELRQRGEYELPPLWVEDINIKDIQFLYLPKFNPRKTKEYKTIKKYYRRYGTFKRPIILDKNMIVLDELMIYLVARDNDIKRIPVIILDNVKVC